VPAGPIRASMDFGQLHHFRQRQGASDNRHTEVSGMPGGGGRRQATRLSCNVPATLRLLVVSNALLCLSCTLEDGQCWDKTVPLGCGPEGQARGVPCDVIGIGVRHIGMPCVVCNRTLTGHALRTRPWWCRDGAGPAVSK
jgi:hypothetical protein